MGARGRHRQGRCAQHRPRRRRAGARRREDRLRVLGRSGAAGAARGGAGGAGDRALGLDGRAAGVARAGRPRAVPADRPGRDARRPRQGPAARGHRSRGALARFADHAGDGEPRRVARHDPRARERRHAGGRRPPAGAVECLGDHRARRAARAGLRGWRRAFRLHRVPGGRALARPGARGRAHGPGEPRSRAGAGRHDDRRARLGLARRAAARGGRPRARGRFQPQGHVGVQRADRPAGRGSPASRSSTTGRWPRAAARSTSTTRAPRRSARR